MAQAVSRCSRPVVVGVAAVLALTVTACGSTQPAPPPAPPAPSVSPQTAVRTVPAVAFLAVAERPGTVVVDVRTPQEYAAGHVKGAVNISVEDPSFDAKIAELDRAGTYAVYCRSGNRSGVASQAMAAAGFASVVNLAGGLTDLQAAGADVVS